MYDPMFIPILGILSMALAGVITGKVINLIFEVMKYRYTHEPKPRPAPPPLDQPLWMNHRMAEGYRGPDKDRGSGKKQGSQEGLFPEDFDQFNGGI